MNFLIEDKNRSGLYKITNIINDKYYVGSTYKFSKRYNEHVLAFLAKRHHNKQLSRFVEKYGIDKLNFELIEYCEIEKLEEKEQYLLDTLENLFNETKDVKSINRNKQLTEEHKQNISKSLKNYKRTEKHKFNLKNATKGKTGKFIRTEETLNKLRNKKRSIEFCNNVSKRNKGRKITWELKHSEDIKSIIGLKNSINKCNKRNILKLDLNNNLIKEYSSITKAALEIEKCKNFNSALSSISDCLREKTKKSFGYKWKYKI